MFTVLQTLILWNINPRNWVTQYLTACAKNGGKAPSNLAAFLPWEMTPEQLATLRLPVPVIEVNHNPLIEDSG